MEVVVPWVPKRKKRLIEAAKDKVPKKEAKVPKKEAKVPKKEAEVPKKEAEVPKKEAEVPKKEAEEAGVFKWGVVSGETVVKQLTCLRCGHTWWQKPLSDRLPIRCSKCISSLWDMPYMRRKSKPRSSLSGRLERQP